MNEHGQVDWLQPVNWDSPLNRGLVSWWMAGDAPYWGGPRFLDICQRNHGTLTNGPTWTGARGRPGGWGAVSFDGTDDHVHLGVDLFETQSQGTITAWIYPTSVTHFPIFGVGENDDANTVNLWWFRITSDVTGDGRLQVFDRENVHAVYGSTVFAAGSWYHVAVTSNNTAWALYVNGKPESLTLQSGSNSGNWWDHLTGTPNDYQIGRIPRGTGFLTSTAQGLMDDLRLWNRGLSDSEIAGIYQTSLRSYPNELNWLRRNWYAVQDEGGGGATAARYLTLLGVG